MMKVLTLLALLMLGGLAQAAPDALPTASADKADQADKDGFVPVKEGESLGVGEVIPASKLVAGAYGFILAAVVVWVASVAMRARKLEDELVALRAKIEKA